MTTDHMDWNEIPSPCFVLDEAKFLSNLNLLHKAASDAGVHIIPALKGFANWKSFHHIREKFSGASASSLNEARLAFEKLGTRSHVYAPAYDAEMLTELLPYAERVSFNSLGQWEALSPMLIRERVSCGLRVNPGYSPVKTDLYNPCAPGSRLGAPIEKLPNPLPQGMEGLHIHNLCESNHHSLEKTLDILAKKIPDQLRQIKWLNLGGGHLMTSSEYDVGYSVQILRNFRDRFPLEITLEPGAAFVWQAGVLAAKVLDIVENEGVQTAMLNISFAAHLPDCLEMPYLPVIRGATIKGGNHRYRLGGTTCLAGDYLADYGFEKPLKIGDALIFEDMMHYTTVKTTQFNGVKHPSIGIWKTYGSFELWKKFDFQDYCNRLS